MDRNPTIKAMRGDRKAVALRKESVDRNYGILHLLRHTLVALRKESVDRNARASSLAIRSCGSLSARRAWIEMRAVCSALIACSRRSPQGERG